MSQRMLEQLSSLIRCNDADAISCFLAAITKERSHEELQHIDWGVLFCVFARRCWFECNVQVASLFFHQSSLDGDAKATYRAAFLMDSDPMDEEALYANVYKLLYANADVPLLRRLLYFELYYSRRYLLFLYGLVEHDDPDKVTKVLAGLGDMGMSKAFASCNFHGRIDITARLLRQNFLEVRFINTCFEFAHVTDLSLAWLTACSSKIRKHIFKHPIVFSKRCIECPEKLSLFGIKITLNYTGEYVVKNANEYCKAAEINRSFRRTIVDRLATGKRLTLDVMKQKVLEAELCDAMYMCLYHNRLSTLKSILNKFKAQLTQAPFAVHWAVRSRKHQVLKFVLGRDTSFINIQCEFGFTPLMLAVFTGTVKLVQMLLSFGAMSTTVSRENKTAYDYARQIGNHAILSLLG